MLVEVRDLRKYFPVRKGFLRTAEVVKAVDGVSLSLREGENLGLVGESGSGKTTLGRLILRLYEPDEGIILIDGKDMTRSKGRALVPLRKMAQMIFQDPYSSLDPRYTVRNILRESLSLSAPGAKGEEELSMRKILDEVGLPGASLNRFPHEFSGGERQRIAIARALLMRPKLLVLDEAVSNLDVLVQDQILELLAALQKRLGVTYLFISHNLRVVRKICDRIAVMYRGRIVEIGPGREILTNPIHPYTRELLSAALHYKAGDNEEPLDIPAGACLQDVGNGHWVLK